MKHYFYLNPPHTIDVTFEKLLRASVPFTERSDPESRRVCVDSEGGSGDVYYSVRSAWDVFLTVQKFPQGSEIIMSGINIPHMAEIVQIHGLTPVYADIDQRDLLPTLEEIKSKRTVKTVAVLCAHLFGSWSSLDAISAWCRQVGLLFVEDCAQSFMGRDFSGTSVADVTLFSFGTIKRSTALGGAVVFVRRSDLRRKMLACQAAYREASVSSYRRKCLKVAVLKICCWPWVYASVVNIVKLFGCDPEKLLRESVRGFPTSSLPHALRFKPHVRLEKMVIECWLESSRADWLRHGQRVKNYLEKYVGIESTIAGNGAQLQSHWLVPILSKDPLEFLQLCRRSGMDATRGVTSLSALAGQYTPNSISLLQQIVYFPARRYL